MGTATMVFDHIAACTVKMGEDEEELSRFSFITVEGKDSQKLTFITGYQICKGSMHGTTTSCMQQKEVINDKEMKQGKETSNPTTEELRTKFIADLITFIKQLQAAGHAIVLALDANETPTDAIKNGEIKQGSFSYLLQQTGLTEVSQEHHRTVPDSTYYHDARSLY